MPNELGSARFVIKRAEHELAFLQLGSLFNSARIRLGSARGHLYPLVGQPSNKRPGVVFLTMWVVFSRPLVVRTCALIKIADPLQVPVSELVGKHVLIYFSAHWCPPCRNFTPLLVEAYNEIKGKESAFEVIFVSSDHNQAAFDEYYAEMPWLALPFGDERKAFLSRRFKVRGIPFLVAIGPDGKTITTEARLLIAAYGADACPFTEDHIMKLKERPDIEDDGEAVEADVDEADTKDNGEDETKGDYICEGDVCRKK